VILQGNRDMTIAVHDFWNRPKYGGLLKYLTCACRVDSPAILFSKSTIDCRSLEVDLLRYSRQIL
jgi:hypothetical protein